VGLKEGALIKDINAASMVIVSLPHIGLSRFSVPLYSAAGRVEHAKVSCIGASRGILRYPLSAWVVNAYMVRCYKGKLICYYIGC